MAIDYTLTMLGKVNKITIDGTDYEVTGDGAMITQLAEINIQPVIYSVAPRVTVGWVYYRVDTMLPENTLANLNLAWTQSESVYTGANFGTIYLGTSLATTAHTLVVVGIPYSQTKRRRYYFDQCVLFEPKPQQHNPSGVVFIPISFYAYGSDSAAVGREVGRVEQDN